ncbi:hypothetical protein ACWEBX_41035, partial [Streptomyces sp. NPDC005070]
MKEPVVRCTGGTCHRGDHRSTLSAPARIRVSDWCSSSKDSAERQLGSTRTNQSFLLMLGMGAFLVCALAIPRAFDDGGVVFGLGF